MKYKGIIFDLDGVICHTDKYHYKAWKAVADELSIEFNEEINNRLRGVSRAESFEIILEKHDKAISPQDKLHYIEKKNNIYCGLLIEITPKDVEQSVLQTLIKLKEQNIKLAIGSSSKNAGYILDRLGIKDYFDAVSDGNNISRSKPDPEVFLKAAAYLSLSPKDCLVVEDAEAGVEAAHNGEMDCAAIGDATRCNKAKYNINSLSELISIVI